MTSSHWNSVASPFASAFSKIAREESSEQAHLVVCEDPVQVDRHGRRTFSGGFEACAAQSRIRGQRHTRTASSMNGA